MQELLTALDITNKNFSRSFRGYNEAQVDEYLENVAVTVQALTQSKRELERQLRQSKAALEKYEKDKTQLQETLLMAQKTAEKYLEDSKQRAIEIRREAEEAAKKEAERLALQGKQLAEEIRQIRVIRDTFASSFRDLLAKFNRALDFNYQRTGLDDATDTVIDYLEDIEKTGKSFFASYVPEISEQPVTQTQSVEENEDAETETQAETEPLEISGDSIEEYDVEEEDTEEAEHIENDDDLDYRY